jgi:3-deoxy-manno-octulosonate cytidylyltransferase (CMP-KDO synthetase)
VKTVAVIPARLGSTRLQRKALADICGRPLIARVVERVRSARGLAGVYVATDDEAIGEAASTAGAEIVMTPSELPSGTDRVAEAARSIKADFILNIQGDEPLIPPAAIEALARTLEASARHGVDMATLARPLEAHEVSLPQVVKVVLAEDSTALYFSRSLVPFPRTSSGMVPLAHIGLYGYTKPALSRFAALPRTALEKTEGLEQLRALGHGWKIIVATGAWKTQSVDTADDLAHVRARWAAEMTQSAPQSGA